MKKFLTLFLSLALCCSFTGCIEEDDAARQTTAEETQVVNETTESQITTIQAANGQNVEFQDTEQVDTESLYPCLKIERFILKCKTAYKSISNIDVTITKSYKDELCVLTVTNNDLGDFAEISCKVTSDSITGFTSTLDSNVWTYSLSNNNAILGASLVAIPALMVFNEIENLNYDLEMFFEKLLENHASELSVTSMYVGKSFVAMKMDDDVMYVSYALADN